MNISTAIETVIRNHERSLISLSLKIGGQPPTSALFTQWMKKRTDELRELFFGTKRNPYEVDIYKLCYLARYTPITTASMRKLVYDWGDDKFDEWVSSM